MLKLRYEIEDWRELVTWDDSSDRDTIAWELRHAVLAELYDLGVEYERSHRQSVGAFVIVQAGNTEERAAFDAALDKHVAVLRAETKNEWSGFTVQCGFLTGNFGGEIDAEATAEVWRQALQKALPGAEVDVAYQDASGALPAPLKLRVYPPDGADIGGDGDIYGDSPGARAWRIADATLDKIEPVI